MWINQLSYGAIVEMNKKRNKIENLPVEIVSKPKYKF